MFPSIIEKNRFMSSLEVIMSLVKTWYSIEDALSKFGIDRQKLDAWIEAGLVRTEEEKGEVVRVNIDDVRIEVENMVNADE